MDKRYIFAAVKDLKIFVKDIADGPEFINFKFVLDQPEQYIEQEELDAFGELIEKHIVNLRMDILKTVNDAISENEDGDYEVGERLDDPDVYSYPTEGTIQCMTDEEEVA